MNDPEKISITDFDAILEGSSIEMKHAFGSLARRIVDSNSGQFRKISTGEVAQHPTNKTPVSESEFVWDQYRQRALQAAKEGNVSQAEAMWLKALNEAKTFEKTEPRLAYTLDNIASLYYNMGHYEQAELFCRRAIYSAQLIFGNAHPKLANCLNNLAGIFYSQRRYREALPVAMRVLSIYENTYGQEHQEVGMAANNLAMVLHADGKHGEAEKLYLRAYRIRSKALGPHHPVVVAIIDNYRNLRLAQLEAPDSDSIISRCRIRSQLAC
jgi:tetratricopeptide (TPR) repeat protein